MQRQVRTLIISYHSFLLTLHLSVPLSGNNNNWVLMCFLSFLFSLLQSRSLESVLALNGSKWAESKESCFGFSWSSWSLSSLFHKNETVFFLPPTGPLKYFTRLDGFMYECVCVCEPHLNQKYDVQCDDNTKTYKLLAETQKRERLEGETEGETRGDTEDKNICLCVCAGFFLFPGQRSDIRSWVVCFLTAHRRT